MLYNIPSRTGYHLLSITVTRLAKLSNIITSLKESRGDLSCINHIHRLINVKNFI
ncbi:MAG: dihydrodipicolinate synthase family protein [Arsenophonus sp. NC-TX2-MAG3]